MKRMLLYLMFFSVLSIPFSYSYAKDTKMTVSVKQIPASVEEFLALRDTLATTPEGGAAVMLVALMEFMQNKTLGMQCITIALDQNSLSSGNTYKGFTPGNGIMYHLNRFSIPERKHIPWAYVVGATSENNYEVPLPYSFEMSRNKSSEISEDMIKVFVSCYGTSYPRPVTLKKNNRGIWKAYELSSLFLDVVGPAKLINKDDDL